MGKRILRRRKKGSNPFILDILKEKKIFLVGEKWTIKIRRKL